MQVGGERWLAEGLGYREKGDTCPFCAQSLVSTDFVKTLKYFFSKEYDALKNRVHALHAETNNALGDRVSGNIETIVATNTATAEFWKKHLAVEPPVLDDHDVGEELRALRISASGLVERKTHAVLEPIEPDGDFNKKVSKLVEMVHALEHYNVAVTRANEMIAQLKVDVKAINQQAAIKEVARLKAQQHRYEKKAVEICDAVASRKKEKEEAEAQKDASKQALDKYTETVMVSYEQAINRYLDDFHTGFSLTKTTYDYRGAGVPRSSYQIVINNVPIELGDAETPLHSPSFKNTLSSGDRSTLALAFFLAQLDRDAAKAKKIVVLDDPFTSQDRFRQSETVSKITRCGESCAQVIVLSHDLKFLEMLWSRLQPKAVDCKALQFVGRGEENTHIEALDIDKATNATYRQDFEEMQRFYSDGIGAPLDISRKIRPTVEAHLRHTRSDLADAVSLGKMLAVIRAGGENHPLARQYKELEDINEYATKYHHGEKPGAPAHQIDDQELRGCIKKTRRVIDIG